MIRFRVANTVFEISFKGDKKIFLDSAYDDFMCNDEPDIRLDVIFDALPDIHIADENMVFNSEGTWKLFKIDGKDVITTTTPFIGKDPYRIAIFNESYTHGEIYVNIPQSFTLKAGSFLDPFEFPLSEVLMVCYLAKQHGIMVHACGVIDNNHGLLFNGNSTHGKSTTARLWQNHARILNDDRIIIRKEDGIFKMYGTPWHGAFHGVAAMSVPLEKIFFLRHAKENKIVPKSGVAAASMLFTRCFPAFWDQAGIDFTLNLCGQIVTSVPCYELGFVPDESVVDFIRCIP
jgi:hypothetical protein